MQAESSGILTIVGFSIARGKKTPRLICMTYFIRQFAISLILPIFSLGVMASPSQAASQDQIEAFLTTTGFDVALESIAQASASAPQMLGIDPDGFGIGLGASDRRGV